MDGKAQRIHAAAAPRQQTDETTLGDERDRHTTNRSLEPKEILENALDIVLEVMQFQAGAIWLRKIMIWYSVSRGLPRTC
jgi:hypothetical protein